VPSVMIVLFFDLQAARERARLKRFPAYAVAVPPKATLTEP
jgi:hypothetical protein